MEQAAQTPSGPFWLRIAESGEHCICGRHGKVYWRYPANAGAMADAHINKLMRANPKPSVAQQANVLLRAAKDNRGGSVEVSADVLLAVLQHLMCAE